MLAFINMCLNIAKSSTLHENSDNNGTSHYRWLCVVVVYLIDSILINLRLLVEGGANLPVCTDYAEFMHLQLIAS